MKVPMSTVELDTLELWKVYRSPPTKTVHTIAKG